MSRTNNGEFWHKHNITIIGLLVLIVVNLLLIRSFGVFF